MKAEEALARFIKKVMLKRWRDRYLQMVRKKRGQQRFLDDLWHEMEDRLDPEKSVKRLPETVWAMEAYSFSGDEFGIEEDSMKDAFESLIDGALIIDREGKYGIHKPEEFVDKIKYYRA